MLTRPGCWNGHQFRIVSAGRTSHTRVIACDTCGIRLHHIGEFRPVSQPTCTMAPAGANLRSIP